MGYELADRLFELRRKAQINQEELAERLGVSRQAVSKWERGESQPDLGNLVAIADAYDISLDELVRGKSALDSEEVEEVPQEVPDAEPVAPDADAPALESAEPAPATPEPAVAAPHTAAPEAHTTAPQPTSPVAHTTAPQPPAPAPEPQRKGRANPWLTFPYPLLVVLVFLVVGFAFGAWNPAWVLFLTIPFYYWAAVVIVRDQKDQNAAGSDQAAARSAREDDVEVG